MHTTFDTFSGGPTVTTAAFVGDPWNVNRPTPAMTTAAAFVKIERI
jgi:hypothetical protein